MDPTTCLHEIRALIAKLSDCKFKEDAYDLRVEIVDKFEELDGWLSNGGFVPKDWRTPSNETG